MLKEVFLCAVLLLILVYCSKKFGRDKTLGLAVKVLSPICIILFYLSGQSIIVFILKIVNVSIPKVTTSDSIRVAIDSAIVTLFVNTILMLLNSPIKVEIGTKNRQDIDQVITYCNKVVHVDYSVNINFRYKWIKKHYKKIGNPSVRIINSIYTSIAVDKENEYSGIINCDNASQFINIDLSKISNSSSVIDKLYFTLAIQSNKTIKWDDVINTEVYINNKKIKGIHKLFWETKENQVKIIHREENI